MGHILLIGDAMKFHIVGNGENTKDIILTYSLTLDELKEVNKHIRDWNKLIPGTKLKIPTISEVIDQDIMDMDPFIEDYYPKKPIYTQPDVRDNPLSNNEENLIQDDTISSESKFDDEVVQSQEHADSVRSHLFDDKQNIEQISNDNIAEETISQKPVSDDSSSNDRLKPVVEQNAINQHTDSKINGEQISNNNIAEETISRKPVSDDSSNNDHLKSVVEQNVVNQYTDSKVNEKKEHQGTQVIHHHVTVYNYVSYCPIPIYYPYYKKSK